MEKAQEQGIKKYSYQLTQAMSLVITGSVSGNSISDIQISGGIEPYTIIWTNSLGVPPLTGLEAKSDVPDGTYTVMVFDSLHAFAAQDFIVPAATDATPESSVNQNQTQLPARSVESALETPDLPPSTDWN